MVFFLKLPSPVRMLFCYIPSKTSNIQFESMLLFYINVLKGASDMQVVKGPYSAYAAGRPHMQVHKRSPFFNYLK